MSKPPDKMIRRLLFLAELKEPMDVDSVTCLLEDVYQQIDCFVAKLSLLGPQMTFPEPKKEAEGR